MKCLHRTYFLSALSPCVQGMIKATLSSQRCLHDQKVSTLRVTHSKTALEDATKSVNRNKTSPKFGKVSKKSKQMMKENLKYIFFTKEF